DSPSVPSAQRRIQSCDGQVCPTHSERSYHRMLEPRLSSLSPYYSQIRVACTSLQRFNQLPRDKWFISGQWTLRFCQVFGLFEDLDLLSSTPGITVVVGFPFIASPESPCASETRSLFSAGNGRTSTAPSRPQRGSLAHCQARILRRPTNQLSKFRPVTWSESLPSSHCDRLIRRPPNA